MDINAYTIKDEYPQKPPYPKVLRKVVSTLTEDELNTISSVKKEYEKNLELYERKISDYNSKQKKLKENFYNDLKSTFNITDDKLHSRIYSYAYDLGHSEGLHSILSHYEEIVYVIRG